MVAQFHELSKPRASTDELMRKVIKNDALHRKVNELAAGLEKDIGPQVDVLVDIPIGAKFIDTQTNIFYVYEAVATPFKHDDLMMLVMDLAKQPCEDLLGMTYFMIREDLSNRPKPLLLGNENDPTEPAPIMTPHKIINGRDFLKYFVVGRWKLLQNPRKPDVEEFTGEKDALAWTPEMRAEFDRVLPKKK